MIDQANFWWESIAGPKRFTEAVAADLKEKGNVLIDVPDDLPWRREMRATVENELQQYSEMDDFIVDMIDVEDIFEDSDDVGRFLLKRYAPSKASGYRGREKIQQYILNNAVLKNRILWIKGIKPSLENKWIAFCRDYIPAKDSDGRIVLEIRSRVVENERRNLGIVHYCDMVTTYDLSLFNSIYLNQQSEAYSPVWQQYVSIACSTLCDTDAETSIGIIEAINITQQDIWEGLQSVAERFELRGRNNNKHVLSLYRNNSRNDVDKLLWKAQLQILFPLIELERNAFVEEYHDQLEVAISEQYIDLRDGYPKHIRQFGERIDRAEDLELGTIYRMQKLRKDADDTQYLLYLPDEATRNRVELLHEIRNALAHGKACTIDQVSMFINSYPFVW